MSLRKFTFRPFHLPEHVPDVRAYTVGKSLCVHRAVWGRWTISHIRSRSRMLGDLSSRRLAVDLANEFLGLIGREDEFAQYTAIADVFAALPRAAVFWRRGADAYQGTVPPQNRGAS